MQIQMQKELVSSTYDALMTVYEKVSRVKNGKTVFDNVKVLENVPCALCVSRLTVEGRNLKDKGDYNVVNNSFKLFTDPDVVIKPGSIIEVTTAQMTRKYSHSGEGFCYPDHQEFMVKRIEEV